MENRSLVTIAEHSKEKILYLLEMAKEFEKKPNRKICGRLLAFGGYSRRNPPSLHDAGELLLRCICPDYIKHGAAGGAGRN